MRRNVVFGLSLGLVAIVLACEAEAVAPSSEPSCAALTGLCSGSDLLLCSSDGSGYGFVRTCPNGCRDGACVDDPASDVAEPDTEPGDDATSPRGCLGCPCDFGELCASGLVCFSGFCLTAGCQVDADCPAGRRCYLGGCIPALCGNHAIDDGEQCDDGNNKNGDGCNVNCADETGAPLAGGEPLGFTTSGAGMPVAFSACSDEASTGAYAPGATLPLRLCAVSFLDQAGHGLSAAQVAAELERAGQYFTAAGTALLLAPQHVDVLQGGPDQTDPDSDAEIRAVLEKVRGWAEATYPGQCDAVVGYLHSLKSGDASYGGMGTWPSEGLHSAVIAESNTAAVPGETTAHELGHVLGLFHTHETATPDDDGCSDTPPDAGCYQQVSPSCSLTCPDGTTPPASNVMSYYFCDTPGPSSFSACQARRARCFTQKMWPGAACPLPVLSAPADGATLPVGAALTFAWKAGDPDADHTVVVTRGSVDGPVAWSKGAGTLGKATAAAGALQAGAYAWTVQYPGACCPGGSCKAVARTFTLQAVACDGPASQACGWCGTQTRSCNVDGTWSPWGPCDGQGACAEGTLKTCSGGQKVACTAACAWPTCPSCTASCAGKCAGADDGCGGTCAWSSCTGCCEGAQCRAGLDTLACGQGGGACLACVPSADCAEGACEGCGHDAGEPAVCATNDSPGCAQTVASLASQADSWVSMAQPAAPSPADDVDYFRVDLTDTAFFAVLDPAVVVTSAGGVPLTACAWWRNADGSEVTVTSCSNGSPDVHAQDGSEWAGAPGCCQGVPGAGAGAELGLALGATVTGSLLIAVQPAGPASCGAYTFRLRL